MLAGCAFKEVKRNMLFYTIVVETKKMLRNLDGCLEKGALHAAAKGFDPNVLLQSRLAPDMFPLVRQIQAACDQAKYVAARAAGKEAPPHPDSEQTLDEARKRIATVVSYLETFTKSDFDAADTRTVKLPRWEGKSMTVSDYVVEHGLPNFFFHVTTAYAILRHNGVDVGKRDYLGALTMR
jgi:hypothetical protein